MHRMIWLKLGGSTLHLLKLFGSIFMMAATLKLAEATYLMFVEISKVKAAMANSDLVAQFYGWTIDSASYGQSTAVYSFTSQDWIGILAGPAGNMFFWMAMLVIAITVYQSSKVFFPVEEYEKSVSEHHKKLIEHAVAHSAPKKSKK